MSDPRAVRLFDLGDAGSIAVRHNAEAVQLEKITPGHGWRIANRSPRGWVARRRPSQRVGVTLCDGPDDSCTREAELEIGMLADGRWEVAQRHLRKHANLGHIDVGCGGVTVTWDGQRLTMDEPTVVPGWRVQSAEGPTEVDGSWDLVVIWTQGDRDVELFIDCTTAQNPPGRGLMDIDRRHRVQALG